MSLRSLTFITSIVLVSMSGVLLAAEPVIPAVLRLPIWPQAAATQPAEAAEQLKELTPGKVDRFISKVTVPEIYVYRAPAEKANGAAVIICPGGGYGGVAIDREGHDVARWLNTIGVAGIVLKYRMPNATLSAGQKPWPLQDAQRTIRLVRSKAAEWKLDPKRVGIMGFSAGGHLASTAGTHYDAGKPDAGDPLDKLSCRPDFIILGYPVVSFKDPIGHTGSRTALIGKNPDPKLIEEYSNELQVNAQTPPAFLVHAKDDGVKVENSIQFAEAMKKAGVPCQLQLYDKGGHGYGLGFNGGDVAEWPRRCEEWLKTIKMIP